MALYDNNEVTRALGESQLLREREGDARFQKAVSRFLEEPYQLKVMCMRKEKMESH